VLLVLLELLVEAQSDRVDRLCHARLLNDGRDPVQDAEFALVLRDSAVRSQLPIHSTLADI
jgi:hypothetical protein